MVAVVSSGRPHWSVSHFEGSLSWEPTTLSMAVSTVEHVPRSARSWPSVSKGTLIRSTKTFVSTAEPVIPFARWTLSSGKRQLESTGVISLPEGGTAINHGFRGKSRHPVERCLYDTESAATRSPGGRCAWRNLHENQRLAFMVLPKFRKTA